MSEKTVTVQGTVYDKRTGMPLHFERSTLASRTKTAQQIHRPLQKSSTLHRKYVKLDSIKRPEPVVEAPSAHVTHTISTHHQLTKSQATTKTQGIVHFNSSAAVRPTIKQKVISDIAPAPHALANRAAKKLARPEVKTVIKPSQIIKQEAIARAMAQTPDKRDRKEVTQSRSPKLKRFAGLASGALAVLLLGGYFTYLSMPSISTRVAAAQAGIDANYPGYQPTGYSLSGPVAYQQGRVTMKFAANAAPSSFTLDQTKSGWDSSAVLDSYVRPKAGDNYMTTTANGLTVYSYGTNAAWVNRGILYTISGDAPLSDDQIQRIATSL